MATNITQSISWVGKSYGQAEATGNKNSQGHSEFLVGATLEPRVPPGTLPSTFSQSGLAHMSYVNGDKSKLKMSGTTQMYDTSGKGTLTIFWSITQNSTNELGQVIYSGYWLCFDGTDTYKGATGQGQITNGLATGVDWNDDGELDAGGFRHDFNGQISIPPIAPPATI